MRGLGLATVVPHLLIGAAASFSVPSQPLSPAFSVNRFGRRHSQPRCTSTALQDGRSHTTDNKNDDDVPTMDWLTDSLAQSSEGVVRSDGKPSSPPAADVKATFIKEIDKDEVMGDPAMSKKGVSIADEIWENDKEPFETELVPIGGLAQGVLAAQLVTTTKSKSFEPVRYIVALDKQGDPTSRRSDFVMVDIPPYSEQLEAKIRSFVGQNGTLSCILVTNREGIHYDEAPSVYTTRRPDVDKWTNAFEGIEVVAYRLDIPRDCRDFITQRLNGNGPFAMTPHNASFVETGRPLRYVEWDRETAQRYFTSDGMVFMEPETGADTATDTDDDDDDEMYSDESIREREEDKPVLAIHTPGYTFGSVSYIFPRVGICCSGHTIPVEDTRRSDFDGVGRRGPMMDVRGYITTSKAGITLQMESAEALVEKYSDRFDVVMAARNDPLFLDHIDQETRKKSLLGMIGDYKKIGMIYEQLGIIEDDEDEF